MDSSGGALGRLMGFSGSKGGWGYGLTLSGLFSEIVWREMMIIMMMIITMIIIIS